MIYQKLNSYQLNKEIYDEVSKNVKEDDNSFTVDWEALKNTDVVAWVKVGKDISYPVVQGKDNRYYLNHTYNGVYNSGGAIFLNYDNSKCFTDQNSIIYGHRMFNNTMFGPLKQYKKKTKDPYFYIYLPDGTMHVYQFYSVAEVLDGSTAYKYSFADTDDFLDYQEYMKSKSLWSTGLDPEENARYVSLSTCATTGSKQGHRVMLTGKEIDIQQVQEAASWYDPPKVDVSEVRIE